MPSTDFLRKFDRVSRHLEGSSAKCVEETGTAERLLRILPYDALDRNEPGGEVEATQGNSRRNAPFQARADGAVTSSLRRQQKTAVAYWQRSFRKPIALADTYPNFRGCGA